MKNTAIRARSRIQPKFLLVERLRQNRLKARLLQEILKRRRLAQIRQKISLSKPTALNTDSSVNPARNKPARIIPFPIRPSAQYTRQPEKRRLGRVIGFEKQARRINSAPQAPARILHFPIQPKKLRENRTIHPRFQARKAGVIPINRRQKRASPIIPFPTPKKPAPHIQRQPKIQEISQPQRMVAGLEHFSRRSRIGSNPRNSTAHSMAGKPEKPEQPEDHRKKGFFESLFGAKKTPEGKKRDLKKVRILTSLGFNEDSKEFKSLSKHSLEELEANHKKIQTLIESGFNFDQFSLHQKRVIIESAEELESIKKTLGENALYKLRHSLREIIKAIGNKLTIEHMKEITEIAKAMGTNAPYGLRYSLPETIKAIGNKLTIKELRKFTGFVKILPSHLMPAGIRLFSELTHEEILEVIKNYGKIPERLKKINTEGRVENTALDKFLVGSLAGVFDQDNRFEDAKKAFNERWNKWNGKNLPAAINVKDRSFKIKTLNAATELSLLKGKQLDLPSIQKMKRRLSIPSENLTATTIESVSKLSGIKPEGKTEKEQNEFIFNALNALQGKPEELARAFGMLLPLLPKATEMQLPELSENPSLQETQTFLTSAETFLSVHLPETLKSKGISEENTGRLTAQLPTTMIQKEMAKFSTGKRTEEETIELQSSKNALDAYYDALGQNCICRYGFDLEREDFQPIRIVNKSTGEQLGVVYALKGIVNGVPSMVLAGIEPKKRFAYRALPTQFIRELLNQLQAIATENNMTGGVYSNVGYATQKNQYSKFGQEGNDGRIAQYDIIRNAIREQATALIELPKREQIQFPKKFSTPIQNVWKLR